MESESFENRFFSWRCRLKMGPKHMPGGGPADHPWVAGVNTVLARATEQTEVNWYEVKR
jgi:hypothetical protein